MINSLLNFQVLKRVITGNRARFPTEDNCNFYRGKTVREKKVLFSNFVSIVIK